MKKKTNLSKRSIKSAFDTIILNCKTKHKNYCKGCLFNELIKRPGEYNDYEWTDEDDKNYNNITFCEAFFKLSPEYWNLKKEINIETEYD